MITEHEHERSGSGVFVVQQIQGGQQIGEVAGWAAVEPRNTRTTRMAEWLGV